MPVQPSECSCEYPCSCIVYNGKHYSDRDAVIRALEDAVRSHRDAPGHILNEHDMKLYRAFDLD